MKIKIPMRALDLILDAVTIAILAAFVLLMLKR